MRAVKELARSYVTISKDQARVMTRVKALYRSWGIACSGKQIYTVRHRASWLGKIKEPGVRRRAEFYYQQLDGLRSVRRQVRRELLLERCGVCTSASKGAARPVRPQQPGGYHQQATHAAALGTAHEDALHA
jgi:hypothetical protein